MARRRRSNNSNRDNNSSTKKLLINARESEESRIAVLQGGVLEEYYIERESLGSTLGNIYKARITNVEKSIGAAFVDFGHSRQGFLHVSDLSMAAVGDEAAELLAGVQAAREVAHEEDVVEPRKKSDDTDAAKSADENAADEGESTEGGADDAEPSEAAAESANAGAENGAARGVKGEAEATSDDSTAAAPEATEAAADDAHDPDPDVADLTDATDDDSAEDDDQDDPAYTPDEEESDDTVWSGTVSGSERGAQLKSLDQSDDEDDEHEPEVAELIGEGSGEDDDETSNSDDENADDESDDDDTQEAVAEASTSDDDPDPSPEDDSPASAEASTEDEAEDASEGTAADADSAEDDQPILLEIMGPLPTEGHEAARAELAAAVSAEHRARSRGRRRGRRRGRGRSGRSEQASASAGAEGSAASANGAAMESEAEEGSQERTRGKRGRRGGRPRGKREVRSMPAIEDILQKGQEIVVQVIKDGIGTKGPTLTTYLSIPGRFIVLMPGINKRGVSRKVTDQKERERLKAIVRDLEAPEPLGFIVRTAGAGASKEDLERDLAYLISLYEDMQGRTKDNRAPVMLYQENDLVIRTLRDLYDGQGEIVIDHQGTADKARTFLEQIMPQCLDKVQAYTDTKPIFSHYGLEAELTRLLKSRLELKSGASLIIEQTEALVAIDVNSGRYKPEKHKDIDETGFQVNCEAAVEIARQIRLRDMGGVVVIDFIDMRQEKHRKHLERLFKDELRKDRARIKVARFSPFGILEMTRQRVRPSLKRTVHQSCPYCDATGYIPSDETSCLSVVRKIRENLWRPGAVLVVTVRPEVAEAIVNTQRRALVRLEDEGKKQIFIRADHRLAYEEVDLKAMITLPDEVDHRRA